MRRSAALLPLLLLASILGGCPRGEGASAPPEVPDPVAAPTEPDVQLPRVHEDNKSLLFSYLGEQGRVVATADLHEVPSGVRARVLVVDLSQKPEERQAHKVSFFTDLSAAADDGTYPVSAVSRFDAARGEGLAATLPAVPPGTVIVYSAEWCGFCQKAKAWLSEEEVAYVERDVEKQPGVAKELREKLVRASIQGSGVPVIDWEGELIMGFDKRRLQGLLDERREKKKESAADAAP